MLRNACSTLFMNIWESDGVILQVKESDKWALHPTNFDSSHAGDFAWDGVLEDADDLFHLRPKLLYYVRNGEIRTFGPSKKEEKKKGECLSEVETAGEAYKCSADNNNDDEQDDEEEMKSFVRFDSQCTIALYAVSERYMSQAYTQGHPVSQLDFMMPL
jgi:hypothetical protein